MRTYRTNKGLALLCVAGLFSTAAPAAVVNYTFTGSGGLNPVALPNSGWMTENRTSFPGLSPVTVLDNGVTSIVGPNWLTSGLGTTAFDGTYSGTATVTDGVLTAGTLSWTGTIGFEASASPGYAGIGFYAIGLTNGSYNLATGAYTGGFACAANPSGPAAAACSTETAANHNLPLGTISFTDNMNGTVSILMGSNDFTNNGGVKDNPTGANNGSPDYNHRVTWTLGANAQVVPLPATVWLLGSALLGTFGRRFAGRLRQA